MRQCCKKADSRLSYRETRHIQLMHGTRRCRPRFSRSEPMSKLLSLAFIILTSLPGSTCQPKLAEDQSFVLSNGFTGRVIIFFGQQDGTPAKYEYGRRVFEVPDSGILKSQLSPNPGWRRFDKYFYLVNGIRIEVPYVVEPRDLDPDKVQACCFSSGRAAKTPNDGFVQYVQFYVGTKAEINDAFKKAEKVNPSDLINK